MMRTHAPFWLRLSHFIALTLIVVINLSSSIPASNDPCGDAYNSCMDGAWGAFNSCLNQCWYAAWESGDSDAQEKCNEGCTSSFDATEKGCRGPYNTCKNPSVFNIHVPVLTHNSDRLDVPLRNQNDPANGENGKNYCGPAALGMMLDYYGAGLSTAELAEMMNTDVNGYTSKSTIVSTAKELGFSGTHSDTLLSRSVGIPYLEYQTENGNPVIVNVDEKDFTSGHWMVVTGVTSNSVNLNDPWTGTPVSYGRAEFNSMWRSEASSCVVLQK
jgi:uncharacterized protein YvpB